MHGTLLEYKLEIFTCLGDLLGQLQPCRWSVWLLLSMKKKMIHPGDSFDAFLLTKKTSHQTQKDIKQCTLTQPKLLDKSFPVPRGMIAAGGAGSRLCLYRWAMLPNTQPTVPSPPATCNAPSFLLRKWCSWWRGTS